MLLPFDVARESSPEFHHNFVTQAESRSQTALLTKYQQLSRAERHKMHRSQFELAESHLPKIEAFRSKSVYKQRKRRMGKLNALQCIFGSEAEFNQNLPSPASFTRDASMHTCTYLREQSQVKFALELTNLRKFGEMSTHPILMMDSLQVTKHLGNLAQAVLDVLDSNMSAHALHFYVIVAGRAKPVESVSEMIG